MRNAAPAARPEAGIRFQGDGRPINAEVVGTGSMSTIYSDGLEGCMNSFPRPFYRANSGNISFRTRQAIWPDGRLEMPGFHDIITNSIDSWTMQIRLPLANPDGCESSFGGIRATLAGDVGRPPSPPSSTTEPFTGYWWDIPCSCEEPYDDDITRTRAFTSLIRACMTNERGGPLMCALSAPRLEPTNTAGRRCIASAVARRVDDGPMSCYAVPGSISILENNR